MAPPVGFYVDVGSAILLLVVGAAVLAVRPRRVANLTFAGFAIGLGIGFTLTNLVYGGVIEGAWAPRLFMASSVFVVLAGVGIVLTALRFPVRLTPAERGLWIWPAAIATVSFAPSILLLDRLVDMLVVASPGFRNELRSGLNATVFSIGFLQSSMWFALMLWARRHRVLAGGGTERLRPFGLMAAAIVLYPAAFYGSNLVQTPRFLQFDATVGVAVHLLALCMLATIFWWLRGTTGPGARTARTLAILIPGAGLFGAVATMILGPGALDASGIFGTARTVGVLIVGYAILRLQLLDVDLRVKWTIGKGTVATILLVVFFVVSTISSELLVESFGPALGGLAAGLLLFAINPLQRLGDRVANVAMPHVEDTDEYRTVRKREVYHATYATMASDGHVSEKEKDALAKLADQLGLTPGEVRSIEKDAAA